MVWIVGIIQQQAELLYKNPGKLYPSVASQKKRLGDVFGVVVDGDIYDYFQFGAGKAVVRRERRDKVIRL